MATRGSGSQTTAPPPGAPPFMGRPGGGPGARFAGKVERAKDTRATLLRLWGYLGRQKAALIATALMVTATVGLDLLGPYLLGQAIDRYIIPRDLPGPGRIALLMFLVSACTSLLNWLQSYVMVGASQRTVRDIRTHLFAKLQCLPLGFFDQRAHGDLMSRLTNDVEDVNQVLSGS